MEVTGQTTTKAGRGALHIFAALLACAFVAAASAQEIKAPPPFVTSLQGENQDVNNGHSSVELHRRNPRYQLCKGDVFDLNFPLTPEFNQTVTVHPDGYMTLTGLGDFYVAGKTVPELREVIRGAYANILHDPVINVVLKDFEKPFFVAGGEVGHPGKYELREDLTLTEAIAIAGGFTGSSKHSQVLLFRRVSNDWAQVKVVDVKKMFKEGNLAEDVHLQPGDMLFVPQNRISKIRPWVPTSYMGISPSL